MAGEQRGAPEREGLLTVLASPVLRAATAGGKLVLTLYLAREMAPDQLGVYGVMVAALTVAAQLVGLEFASYAERELLRRPDEERASVFRDQLAFQCVAYAVSLPLACLPFLVGWLPGTLLGFYLALLVLEHLGQETFRLLVVLGRPAMAHVTLFLRGGAWALAVVAVGVGLPATRSLGAVWVAWLLGGGLSLVTAAVALRGLGWRHALRQPVDWAWVRRGVPVGLRLLAGTFSLVAITYADRFALEHVEGAAAAGFYTFFWGISSVVHTVTYTTFTVRHYPGIVRSRQRGELQAFRRELRRFGVAVLLAAGALGLAALWAVVPVLHWLGRPEYEAHVGAYRILVLAAVVMTVGEVPFFALYAQGRDRRLLVAAVSALGLDVLALAILVPRYGLIGAALATLAARTALLAARVSLVALGPPGSRIRRLPPVL